MKTYLTIALLVLAGCASRQSAATKPATTRPKPADAVVVNLGVLTGRVTLVNAEHQFVVLDFGGQRPPAPGATLAVLRAGKPVATVRVTEPTRGRFVTADVLSGEPRPGDEAR
jgi:hypothetical protein